MKFKNIIDLITNTLNYSNYQTLKKTLQFASSLASSGAEAAAGAGSGAGAYAGSYTESYAGSYTGAGAGAGSSSSLLTHRGEKLIKVTNPFSSDNINRACLELLSSKEFLRTVKTTPNNQIPEESQYLFQAVKNAIEKNKSIDDYSLVSNLTLVGQLIEVSNDTIKYQTPEKDIIDATITTRETVDGRKVYEIIDTRQTFYQNLNSNLLHELNNFTENAIQALKEISRNLSKYKEKPRTLIEILEDPILDLASLARVTISTIYPYYSDNYLINYINKFYSLDENGMSILHHLCKMINESEDEKLKAAASKLANTLLWDIQNQNAMLDYFNLEDVNGLRCFDYIFNRKERDQFIEKISKVRNFADDSSHINQNFAHLTANKSLIRLMKKFKTCIGLPANEELNEMQQEFFNQAINLKLQNLLLNLARISINEEQLQEIIQLKFAPITLEPEIMDYEIGFLKFQLKLTIEFVEKMEANKNYSSNSGNSTSHARYLIDSRIRDETTSLNMREIIALAYFAVCDQERAKSGYENDLIRMSYLIRAIYDFTRNNDGLDHYDHSKPLSEQGPNYNRCKSDSIDVLMSFLSSIHEDVEYIHLRDRDVLELIEIAIKQLLIENHEKLSEDELYLTSLREWINEKHINDYLLEKFNMFFDEATHIKIIELKDLLTKKLDISERDLRLKIKSLSNRIIAPQELASYFIPKEIAKFITKPDLLLSANLIEWDGIIKCHQVPNFITITNEDKTKRKIFWVNYLFDKFSSIDDLDEIIINNRNFFTIVISDFTPLIKEEHIAKIAELIFDVRTINNISDIAPALKFCHNLNVQKILGDKIKDPAIYIELLELGINYSNFKIVNLMLELDRSALHTALCSASRKRATSIVKFLLGREVSIDSIKSAIKIATSKQVIEVLFDKYKELYSRKTKVGKIKNIFSSSITRELNISLIESIKADATLETIVTLIELGASIFQGVDNNDVLKLTYDYNRLDLIEYFSQLPKLKKGNIAFLQDFALMSYDRPTMRNLTNHEKFDLSKLIINIMRYEMPEYKAQIEFLFQVAKEKDIKNFLKKAIRYKSSAFINLIPNSYLLDLELIIIEIKDLIASRENELLNALLKKTIIAKINNLYHDETLLIYAVKKNNLKAVELILSYNPDISIADSRGDTALIIAVRSGKLEITELLLIYNQQATDRVAMTVSQFLDLEIDDSFTIVPPTGFTTASTRVPTLELPPEADAGAGPSSRLGYFSEADVAAGASTLQRTTETQPTLPVMASNPERQSSVVTRDSIQSLSRV